MDSFTLDKIEFDAVRRILAEFCACALGKAMAGKIGPSRNPEMVGRWLELTSQMVEAVRDIGLPPFGSISDISRTMDLAQPAGGASSEDFAQIASTLEGANCLRSFLLALPEKLDKLHELGGSIDDFQAEVATIRAIVDSDGTVRDDASQRLGKLRREIISIAQKIHDVIYGYLRKPEVTRLLQHANVTLHGDRYVLPVKADNRGRLPGVVHRMSHTGATVFVEPEESVELNNRLADLYVDERREIRRLLDDLSIRISSKHAEIASSMRTVGQVDLLSAKAQYAYQFDMTCPTITEQGLLQFTKARHPLLIDQQWRQEREGIEAENRLAVIPIDVRLGSDFDLLIITGSNTGGKTVAMKTVSLLVTMAQSGMHIPAQRGATMPVFRDVFFDIGDEQSLEQSLSTFGAHIKRIRYILRKADRASLVLLDELGAGTDPDEGGAIGQAILDELLHIGCVAMATTHLSVLKAYAMTHDRVDNASVEFDTETLSPTYHLHIGTPGESHAITVAKRLGLPKRLTGSARRHLGEQGKQFRRAIRATGTARQSAEAARSDAVQAQLTAENQTEIYEAKLADLHRLQEELETWMARISEMKAGDELYVPSLGKTGRLVRLELHKQRALIDADNVQVEVPLHELMPDLGQNEMRDQITTFRRQIMEQAKEAEKDRAEAMRIQKEYHQSLAQHRRRARQFDEWLGSIGRLRVGSEVPIAKAPGKGKVVKVDMLALKATLQTDRGEMELSLQDIFPQTGPFAPKSTRDSHSRKSAHKSTHPTPTKRPMPRRSPKNKNAISNHEKLLATPPGKQVFVVPFNKRATLIRINAEKEQATVQSGIFELEIPISDLEPIGEKT